MKVKLEIKVDNRWRTVKCTCCDQVKLFPSFRKAKIESLKHSNGGVKITRVD
jgi:hypothetical protein